MARACAEIADESCTAAVPPRGGSPSRRGGRRRRPAGSDGGRCGRREGVEATEPDDRHALEELARFLEKRRGLVDATHRLEPGAVIREHGGEETRSRGCGRSRAASRIRRRTFGQPRSAGRRPRTSHPRAPHYLESCGVHLASGRRGQAHGRDHRFGVQRDRGRDSPAACRPGRARPAVPRRARRGTRRRRRVPDAVGEPHAQRPRGPHERVRGRPRRLPPLRPPPRACADRRVVRSAPGVRRVPRGDARRRPALVVAAAAAGRGRGGLRLGVR